MENSYKYNIYKAENSNKKQACVYYTHGANHEAEN